MITWNSFSRLPAVMTYWQWGFVIFVFALAIWMVNRLRSQFREDSDDADTALEMLTQFRDLHQQGGLSDDEFRLIRSRLTRTVHAANATEQRDSKDQAVESTPVTSSDTEPVASNPLPDMPATREIKEEFGRMPDQQSE